NDPRSPWCLFVVWLGRKPDNIRCPWVGPDDVRLYRFGVQLTVRQSRPSAYKFDARVVAFSCYDSNHPMIRYSLCFVVTLVAALSPALAQSPASKRFEFR